MGPTVQSSTIPPAVFPVRYGTGKTNRRRSQGLAGQTLQRDLDHRPRRRVRASAQAVRRGVHHQARAVAIILPSVSTK